MGGVTDRRNAMWPMTQKAGPTHNKYSLCGRTERERERGRRRLVIRLLLVPRATVSLERTQLPDGRSDGRSVAAVHGGNAQVRSID